MYLRLTTTVTQSICTFNLQVLIADYSWPDTHCSFILFLQFNLQHFAAHFYRVSRSCVLIIHIDFQFNTVCFIIAIYTHWVAQNLRIQWEILPLVQLLCLPYPQHASHHFSSLFLVRAGTRSTRVIMWAICEKTRQLSFSLSRGVQWPIIIAGSNSNRHLFVKDKFP